MLSSEAELDPKLFDKMSNFFRVCVVFLGIAFSIINTFELQGKDLTANPPIQRYLRETNERPLQKSNLNDKEKGKTNRRRGKHSSLKKDKRKKKENKKQKIQSSNNSKKKSRIKRRFKSRNKKSKTTKKKGKGKVKSRNLKNKIKNKNKQSKSPKYTNNGKGKDKKKQKTKKKKLKKTKRVSKKKEKRRNRPNGKGKIKKKREKGKGKKKKGKKGNNVKKSGNKGKKRKGKKEKKNKKIGNKKKGKSNKIGNKDKKKQGKKNNKSRIKGKGRQTSPEDCLKAAVSIMETYRFQVTNFDRQKKRVERQLTVASSKANKSTVFPILAGYVGGLSCSNSSSKAKLTDLNSTLSQCQTNVFKACVTDMPKANKTFVDECVTLTEIFIVSILSNLT